jgi:hypothetical protein
VWLAVDLGVVLLAIVLVVVFGVHSYSRFRRMNRFGRRAGERVSGLAERAGALGERIDSLAEESAVTDQRSRDLADRMTEKKAARDMARTTGHRR